MAGRNSLDLMQNMAEKKLFSCAAKVFFVGAMALHTWIVIQSHFESLHLAIVCGNKDVSVREEHRFSSLLALQVLAPTAQNTRERRLHIIRIILPETEKFFGKVFSGSSKWTWY